MNLQQILDDHKKWLNDEGGKRANLSDANLRGADLPTSSVKISRIHNAVLAAATRSPDSLDMDVWHTCETTHCRAGWVTTLAGDGGKALEDIYGCGVAAALIYMASDPGLERVPNWIANNDDALADMRRLAEAEV